jgi:hypothetical protein
VQFLRRCSASSADACLLQLFLPVSQPRMRRRIAVAAVAASVAVAGVGDLKLHVYEALSYLCMRP